ncbi:MAG: hypothetical protein LBN19_00190 [Endomicrobium sp.]|jgi:hypothetical protein|nr:hypothetical protein [Endomicrobium sp.]
MIQAFLMLVFNSVVFAVQKEDRTMIKGLRPMAWESLLPQFLMMKMCSFTILPAITRRCDCLTQFSFIDIAVNREIIDSYLNNKEYSNSFCEDRRDFMSKMAFYLYVK